MRIAAARIAAAILGCEAWKRLGFVRLADYARERVGISPRELQELGRVGGKLDDLPALEAALAEGRVCWSKARLIARIATPADEQEWIECAEQLTARELAKKIRAAQAERDDPSVEPADDDELPTQFFELACSAQVQRQWHRVRQLAHRVAGHSVSPAECIEMVTAEVCSALPIEPDAPAEAPNRRGVSSSEAFEPRWPSPPGRDPPIPRISERDDYMYADSWPTPYRSGEISWVQADLLVPIAFGDFLGRWMEHWIRWAKRVAVRRLRDDVERARLIRDTEGGIWSETGGLPEEAWPSARAPATKSGAKMCASSTVGFTADEELIGAFWATLWTVRKRIERATGVFPSEGEAFEAMLEHVLDEWGADARVRREHRIMARDGWRCVVPVCTSRRNLHAHHLVPRSQGGGDEEGNLVTLGASHHLRGVHGGTIEISGKAPGELVFKLGTRPDGPPLAVYRSGGRIVEAA